MAENNLLAQAQQLQRLKLLEQAQAIQQAKTSDQRNFDTIPSSNEEEKSKGLLATLGRIGAGKPGPDIGEQAAAYGYEHPAQVGGLIGSMIPIAGEVGPLAKGVQMAMRAGGGGATAQAAKDISQNKPASDVIQNAASEGATQAATYGVPTAAISAAAPVISAGFKNMATSGALKAAGAMFNDFRSMYHQAPQRAEELGHTLLDNGLVKAGDTVHDIAMKANDLKDKTGKAIGEVYDKVLDSLTDVNNNIPVEAKVQIQEAGLNPKSQADEMKQFVASQLTGKAGSTQAINKVGQVIDEISANGDGITPHKAIQIRSDVSNLIKWGKKNMEQDATQQGLLALRDYMSSKINGQVELLDSVLQSPQSAELARANKLYGNVSEISDIATDRMLRENASRPNRLESMIIDSARRFAGPLKADVANQLSSSFSNGIASKPQTYALPLQALTNEPASTVIKSRNK